MSSRLALSVSALKETWFQLDKEDRRSYHWREAQCPCPSAHSASTQRTAHSGPTCRRFCCRQAINWTFLEGCSPKTLHISWNREHDKLGLMFTHSPDLHVNSLPLAIFLTWCRTPTQPLGHGCSSCPLAAGCKWDPRAAIDPLWVAPPQSRPAPAALLLYHRLGLYKSWGKKLITVLRGP